MRAPDFWMEGGLLSALLAPIGWLYGVATFVRLAVGRPWRAPVPVVCVGNLTAGGSGKTPVCLNLGRRLKDLNPHYVSRGYGGSEQGPLLVDPDFHDAAQVGDEPLLLSRVAPTWVARNRAAGARAAVAAGAGALILDDGLQNPSLAKDVSLAVVDGGVGFGNERMIPAGPLREPIDIGLKRVDAVVVLGEDKADAADRCAGHFILSARIVPAMPPENFPDQPLLTFAGIGRPEKFFSTLKAMGGDIIEERTFPDHHPYSRNEIQNIWTDAATDGAIPITTEKDIVRVPAELRDGIRVLTIDLEWEHQALLDTFLEGLSNGE